VFPPGKPIPSDILMANSLPSSPPAWPEFRGKGCSSQAQHCSPQAKTDHGHELLKPWELWEESSPEVGID